MSNISSNLKRKVILFLIFILAFAVIAGPFILTSIKNLQQVAPILNTNTSIGISQNKCLQVDSSAAKQNTIVNADGTFITLKGRVSNTCNFAVKNLKPKIVAFTNSMRSTPSSSKILPEDFDFHQLINSNESVSYEFTFKVPPDLSLSNTNFTPTFQ